MISFLSDFNAGIKYAAVFGNEVNGLSDKSLKYVDHFCEIPQYGTKHSLNVSVCAGIVIWHLCHKLTF